LEKDIIFLFGTKFAFKIIENARKIYGRKITIH